MKDQRMEWIVNTWYWILGLSWNEIAIGLVSGLIAAVLFEICLEYFRKPNLIFEIDPTVGEGQRNQFNDGRLRKWKFINVNVHNKHRIFFFRWLDASANNATAKLSFRTWDTDVEIVKVDNARWNTTRQPLDSSGVDINTVLLRSRESIPVGESSGISIAIKTDQHNSAFAFNNESYLYYPDHPSPFNTLWLNPEFELGSETRYKLIVSVLADGHGYKHEFKVENLRRSYRSIRLVV